ncbi:ATP-binding protein [Pirellulaceae bacterium SH449]
MPMLIGSVLAATGIAIAAYRMAIERAATEMEERYQSIKRVMTETSFPLTGNVLQILSKLTDAHWIKMDAEGKVLENAAPNEESIASFPVSEQVSLVELIGTDEHGVPVRAEIQGHFYQAMIVSEIGQRSVSVGSPSGRLVVLFDDKQRSEIVYYAIVPPLLTGLVTIVLLSSLSFFISHRLVKRIATLKKEVGHIAKGRFEFTLPDDSSDEIGQLGKSIKSMTEQLEHMWQILRQTHSEQVIEHLAGGLAHNLRNTLTGARLAVEFAQREQTGASTCSNEQAENPAAELEPPPLAIAIEQMKQAENYIQRLLAMVKGKQLMVREAYLKECLEGLRTGLLGAASHRSIRLDWQMTELINQQYVKDAEALVSAVSNLVWNAMEAGDQVHVAVSLLGAEHYCIIRVSDNGPGPSVELQDKIFEPFISSKSEGMGLGLPLVKQAADSLKGDVKWYRKDDSTVFELRFPVS